MGRVFIVALLVYAASAATSVQWGDSARLSQQIADAAPSAHLGLGGHPLHTLLGIGLQLIFPWIDRAWLPNLLSALLGALAVTFAAGAAARLGGSLWMTAALLGASHTHWYLSSLAESYTLASATLAFACWAMSKNWPAAAGFALGIAPLGNALPAIAWPGFALWAGRRPSFYLASLCGAAVAFVVYAQALGVTGVLGNVEGQARVYATAGSFWRQLALTPLVLAFQFASPALLSRRRYQAVMTPLLFGAACVALFAATYLRQKQLNLLVAANVLLAIVLGLVPARPRHAALHALFLTALYAASPLYGTFASKLLAARPAPGRDVTYFLQPWKRGRNEASAWASAVVAAHPNAILVADYTLARVLRFAGASRVEETDAFLASPQRLLDAIDRWLEEGPVVFVQDYEPYYLVTAVKERFAWTPCGEVFCVARRP